MPGWLRPVVRVPPYSLGLTPFSVALSLAAIALAAVDPKTVSDALVRAVLALLLGVAAVRFAIADRRLRRTIAELERLSREDRLTGLLNQAEFHRRLEEEIVRAERYGRCLSLIVMDLDGLKRVNDEEGHQKGDDLLRTFARSLRSALRASDLGFRIGGDEFAVLLPETNREESQQVARRLRSALLNEGMARFGTTVSLGSAEFPSTGMTADAVLRGADRAMYAEKERTRAERASLPRTHVLPPEFHPDPARVARLAALHRSTDALPDR